MDGPLDPTVAACGLPLLPSQHSFVIVLRRPLEFTQYTSLVFGHQLRESGLVASMGSVGDAYDNAVAESFFATLKCELLHRQTWPTRAAARSAIFAFIEAWYNPRRRHSTLGYRSPVAYERRHTLDATSVAVA